MSALEIIYIIYSILGIVGVGFLVTILIDNLVDNDGPNLALGVIWILVVAVQVIIVFLVLQ